MGKGIKTMSNQRFQNALTLIPQKVPPIWFMRQAGRYHSHYRKLREDWDFVSLCKKPELAAEVALGPIKDFDFDVAILFSDLLFPLEALGFGLTYAPGPQLSFGLTKKSIKNLKSVDESIEAMNFQGEALKATRSALSSDKSLIGFVGGPWTLYAYAVEGAHKGSLIEAKSDVELLKDFSHIMVDFLIKNIDLQLKSGAEVVMVLDTAAGEVSPLFFRDHLSPHLNKIAKAYPKKLGYYSKGTQPSHLDHLDKDLWCGFGVDHRWDLKLLLQDKSFLSFTQGNFDQALLFSEPEEFKQHLMNFLAPIKEVSVSERAGWVCGLGHGILPKTSEENVKAFVDITREFFR